MLINIIAWGPQVKTGVAITDSIFTVLCTFNICIADFDFNGKYLKFIATNDRLSATQ